MHNGSGKKGDGVKRRLSVIQKHTTKGELICAGHHMLSCEEDTAISVIYDRDPNHQPASHLSMHYTQQQQQRQQPSEPEWDIVTMPSSDDPLPYMFSPIDVDFDMCIDCIDGKKINTINTIDTESIDPTFYRDAIDAIRNDNIGQTNENINIYSHVSDRDFASSIESEAAIGTTWGIKRNSLQSNNHKILSTSALSPRGTLQFMQRLPDVSSLPVIKCPASRTSTITTAAAAAATTAMLPNACPAPESNISTITTLASKSTTNCALNDEANDEVNDDVVSEIKTKQPPAITEEDSNAVSYKDVNQRTNCAVTNRNADCAAEGGSCANSIISRRTKLFKPRLFKPKHNKGILYGNRTRIEPLVPTVASTAVTFSSLDLLAQTACDRTMKNKPANSNSSTTNTIDITNTIEFPKIKEKTEDTMSEAVLASGPVLATTTTPTTSATAVASHTPIASCTEPSLDVFLSIHNIGLDEISRNILHALHYETRFIVTDLVLHWLSYSGSSAYQRQVFASELTSLSIPFEDAWHSSNNTYAFVMNPHDFIFLVSTCIGRRRPELIYIIYHINHINYNFINYKYKILKNQLAQVEKRLCVTSDALSLSQKENFKLLQKLDQTTKHQKDLRTQCYTASETAQKFKTKWIKSDQRVSQLLHELYSINNMPPSTKYSRSHTPTKYPYTTQSSSSVLFNLLCDSRRQQQQQQRQLPPSAPKIIKPIAIPAQHPINLENGLALNPNTSMNITLNSLNSLSLNSLNPNSINNSNKLKRTDPLSRTTQMSTERLIKIIALFSISPRDRSDNIQRWWIVFRQRASFPHAVKSLNKLYKCREIHRWENFNADKFNIFYLLQQECMKFSLKVTKNLIANTGPKHIANDVLVRLMQLTIYQNLIKNPQ